MKVIAKQIPTTVRFKDVELGQVFIYEEGVYMKLIMDYHTYDEVWKAVYLETGELCYFDDLEEVQLPTKIFPMEITY